jgi:hypothetical protein
LITWIASYYLSVIHNSHNLFFPKNLTDKIKKDKVNLSKIKEYSYTFNHDITLSLQQKRVYNEIEKSKNNKILFY